MRITSSSESPTICHLHLEKCIIPYGDNKEKKNKWKRFLQRGGCKQKGGVLWPSVKAGWDKQRAVSWPVLLHSSTHSLLMARLEELSFALCFSAIFCTVEEQKVKQRRSHIAKAVGIMLWWPAPKASKSQQPTQTVWLFLGSVVFKLACLWVHVQHCWPVPRLFARIVLIGLHLAFVFLQLLR